MESLAIRIKQSREIKGFSQKKLADEIGITSSAISQYESTSYFHSEPSLKNLVKLAKALNVSFEWLAMGRGIKEIEDFLLNEQITYKDDNRLISLTKEQKDILLLFEQLPPDWQQKYKFMLNAVTTSLSKS